MDKIIYKQKNKILLALLVLGGVVHASRYISCVSGLYNLANCALGYSHRRSATTSEAFTPVVPSDMGHNPGRSNGPSLPGSSGDTPIGRPTPATDITYASNASKIRFVYKTTGNYITSTPKTTLSEARKSIREALGMSVCIDLMHNDKKITDEEQFADVKGDIQCVIVPLSTKAKRDAEEIYKTLKLRPMYDGKVSHKLARFLETKGQEYWYNKKGEISYLLPNEYVNNFLRVYVDLICNDISKNTDWASWFRNISEIPILIEAIEDWELSHKIRKATLAGDVITGFKSIVKDLLDTPEHIQRKLDTLMTFLDNNRDTVQDRWSEVHNILDKEWTTLSQVEAVRLIQDTLESWKEKNSIIPEERTNNDVFLTSFADMITQSTNNDGKTVEEKVKEFKTFLANNIVSIKDTLDQCKEKFRSKERLLCNECVGTWSVCCGLLTRLNRLCKQNVQSYI